MAERGRVPTSPTRGEVIFSAPPPHCPCLATRFKKPRDQRGFAESGETGNVGRNGVPDVPRKLIAVD